MHYDVAEPNLVSHQSFDDEIVIAHFGTGIYYSLSGSAAEIWLGLCASFDLSEVKATLAPHAAAGPEAFAASVDRFVAELETAGLIRPAAERAHGAWTPTAPTGGWALPQVESFSDMQELLLLDPVHDTSEAGWPYVVHG
ncbi:MAG: PqqD family protein [Methylorubrum rhodinum]|uniref:PqqD family protein n=1 Tax=Methylorubrum rhodinum TaxID=29428 RepID=UPI003BAE29E0